MAKTLPTMRDQAQVILHRIPEDQRGRAFSLSEEVDKQMQMLVYGQLMNVYLQGSKHNEYLPDAPSAFDFRTPFEDPYGNDEEKKPITEGIAQLLLRSGMQLSSGEIVAYDEKDIRIKRKIKGLASELVDLFTPDYGLFVPHAKLDGVRERIVKYLQRKSQPFAQADSLKTSMDRAFGMEPVQTLPGSPLSSEKAFDTYIKNEREEAGRRADREITEKIVIPQLKKTVDATVSFFEDMGRHMMSKMSPQERRRAKKLLKRRAELKAKDPASEPFMFDRTAQILAEEMAKPRPRTKNPQPAKPGTKAEPAPK